MRPNLLALPDLATAATAGRVGGLRLELGHHPVHTWTASRADRRVVLVHLAYAQWAGAALAESLGLCGPDRQFAAACRSLGRRGAGAVVSSFAADVATGIDPAVALADAGGPWSATPIVTLTAHLVARGSRAARAGALILGLPDCLVDAAPAGGLAAGEEPCSPGGPEAARAAEDAATAMLITQLTLLDAALHIVRRRHMEDHPAMRHAEHHTPPRLRLLPA